MRTRRRSTPPCPVTETVVADVRARLTVSGRVQGVFYRVSAAQQAERLGLTGWVRNLPDGRVEAVVQGAEEPVEAMIEWCREGPSHAEVTEVEVTVEDPIEEVGFSIRD